jgi:hypothetical protein
MNRIALNWWGEAPDEPLFPRQNEMVAAREDARPTGKSNSVNFVNSV